MCEPLNMIFWPQKTFHIHGIDIDKAAYNTSINCLLGSQWEKFTLLDQIGQAC